MNAPLKIHNALTDLLGRARMMFAAGFQADGKRDMYSTFGWKKLTCHQDYINKYLRQDIVKRIIHAPVDALWSDPPKVTGDAAFQKAWDDMVAQSTVFSQLNRADILCGLGRYAVLLIGISDGRSLDQPVNQKAGNQVIYLQPYAEGSVDIKEYEKNPQSPRFGLPLFYRITPGAFQTGVTTLTSVSDGIESSFVAHYSRVLHLAENALESSVFGHSRLESVYNVLDDILKVTGGSAEMFWLSANRGLHINVDKDMELATGDAENLADEVDEYANEVRRVIRTRGVEVKSLGSEVADPRGVFDVQLSLLASNTGIPKRVLMGSEAGQLASQQDRANWAIQVEMRISNHGQPIVLIPFVRILIDAGVLPAPSQMTIEWPDAFKMNPLERAQTSAQMARSAANLSKTLKTVSDINIQNATAAQPTQVPAGGGGGFFGNADPKATGGTAAPKMTTVPPVLSELPPKLELLTEEECRSIIGFGKHMPIFDSSGDSNASGSLPPTDSSNVPEPATTTGA